MSDSPAGSECSDSDWCFVSPESINNMVDDDPVGTSEEVVDNNDAGAFINDSLPNKDIEPKEVENCQEGKENVLEDPDLSDAHSDSSSDVDILEESVAANALTNTDEESSSDTLLHSSLKLSMERPQDTTLTEQLSVPTENLPLIKPLGADVSDKETQTFGSFCIMSRKLFNRMQRENQRISSLILLAKMIFAVLMFCTIMPLCFKSYIPKDSLLELSLDDLQSSIQQCLGEQHLAGLKTQDDSLLNSATCIYNVEKYTPTLESFLDSSVKMFLLTGIKNPQDVAFRSFADNHDDIDLDAIIFELQYLKLLPDKEANKEAISQVEESKDGAGAPDILKGMQSIIANLTLANQVLRDQVKNFDMHKNAFKSDDLIVVKDLTSGDEKENRESSKLIQELKQKITWLHIENEKLQEAIKDMRDMHHMPQSTCASKVVPKENSTNAEDLLKNASKNHAEDPGTVDKIKPYLDNLVSTLSGQILNLHSSLANELKEVKRWNELIQNMTMEIRNFPTPQAQGSNWSWREIKENIESVVQETQQDLKEKIDAIQNINYKDAFDNVVQGNKEHVETFLNGVNRYFGVVKEKTQEMLKNTMSNIDADATVDSFWNAMGNLQDKLHYGKFTDKNEQEHAEKHDPERQRANNEPKGAAVAASENWYFKKSKKDANAYDEKRAKSNWLFKRAANRAKHHRKVTKDCERKDSERKKRK